jgi:hypothetical protein
MNFYKPVHDRPNVEVVASLEELRRAGTVSHMRAKITVVNAGTAAADILGSAFVVTGHDLSSGPMTRGQARSVLKLSAREPHPPESYKRLLKVGRVIRAGNSLAPKQKWSTSFVFDANGSTQKVVRLAVYVSLLTHTSDLQVRGCGEREERFKELTLGCVEAKLPSQSWIRSVLSEERYARTILLFSPEKPPSLATRYRYVVGESNNGQGLFRGGVYRVETVEPLVRDSRALTYAEYRLDP